MTIVIRPAPEIFRRQSPLVVVFGAFRELDAIGAMAEAEIALLQGVIDNARRYRQPLAFSRPIGADGTLPRGAWLPGCRPRVIDRLFEHRTPSCFSNPDFAALYQTYADRLIQVAGPESDSSLRATVSDPGADPAKFRIIAPAHPLQNCSAPNGNAPVQDSVSSYCPPSPPVDYFLWLRRLRTVEYS